MTQTLLRRAIQCAALVVIIGLEGCASAPAPGLAAELRRTYHVADVVVSVPADGRVSWSAADREYLTALTAAPGGEHGIVTGSVSDDRKAEAELQPAASLIGSGALTPAGRSYVRTRAAASVKTGLSDPVRTALQGNLPARLRVDIKDLTVVSETQKSFLGSSNVLETEVWLEDPATGRPLTQRVKRKTDIATGGPFAGTIFDSSGAAIKGDPVADLSARHARAVIEWLSPVAVAATRR